MVIWTLAKKDLRLLLRDRRALVILLAMPFLFILVLGMSLGESFGRKPDDRLRVYVVDLDRGHYTQVGGFPEKKWSLVVQDDFKQTGGIRLEEIESLEKAKHMVKDHQCAAVLVFGPTFSQKLSDCSFLDTKNAINPMTGDGISLPEQERPNPGHGGLDRETGCPGGAAARGIAVDDRPGLRQTRR
jgi:hypothetical protein